VRAGDGRTAFGAGSSAIDSDAASLPYGDACAAFYDELYPSPSRPMVDALVALARGGVVLDAGSGTGRVLLALNARGVAVEGIECSTAMIAAMRAKPGAEAISVIEGDFAAALLAPRYALVCCLVNTLALLRDRATQRLAMMNLARALAPGATLLLETSEPESDAPSSLHNDITLTTRLGPRRYAATLCPLPVGELDDWAASARLSAVARWRNWHGHAWIGGTGPVLSIFRRV
jgi:SAM-dependent methyltransferase